MKPPDLAAMIPARNEVLPHRRSPTSIHRALEYAGMTAAEVIVVDDDSTDETSPVARAHGALAVRQSPRGGPLAAWAFGVASSSAPLLFFVDADCHVDQAAFAALLRGFARPEVGVVAARGDLDRGRTACLLVERSAAFSALMLHEYGRSRPASYYFLPIGKLMAVRREAWKYEWPIVAVRPRRRLARETSGLGKSATRRKRSCTTPRSELTAKWPVRLRSDHRRARAPLQRLGRATATRSRASRRRRERATAARERRRGGIPAVRARLRSERSLGQMQAGDGYARWDRRPADSAPADDAAERQSGVRA